jgi:hypothetical protein
MHLSTLLSVQTAVDSECDHTDQGFENNRHCENERGLKTKEGCNYVYGPDAIDGWVFIWIEMIVFDRVVSVCSMGPTV